jgi:nitroreductase / dihydropteridine reductase
MEFNELLMARYATKEFDNKKIDDDTVDQILEMIRFAPSALNIQPWKVKVVKGQETKKKLSAASMDQAQINTCSHLLVFCANTDLSGNGEKVVNYMKTLGIPEENLKQFESVMNFFLSKFNEEKGLCEAQNNVFIAATTALYAAKSLGVDSCPMQGFDSSAYAEILGIPSGLVPTILVPMGYPADKQMPKMRFPKEDIFF